ncbi:YdiU family protein [Mesobacillus subterraneus]|uniref:protein adenylyltransferase SelO n=1 Tax=Mesobacillus subterraneus TaxID=285983 RepID=UPI00273D4B66|nr:YdiU family protein [Mesobacillus subterraneus]WLR54745.1 YdiU family protein [Mesobacillus subterraneus]
MTSNHAGWNIDNSYSQLPNIFYRLQKPTPVEAPEVVIFNESLAEELGLNHEVLQGGEGAEIFSGNEVPDGGTPLAQAYAGHQFGHFTMLGDGRAVLLGEHVTPDGKRFDIQLKGSGRTPYSRGGDGRAGLGPMLREFIISEAMVGLGIPTTRSLAVTTTGEQIIRETMQTGAILTRVAASHLRVGTFQFAANWGKTEDLRALADYAIERHYPEVEGQENRYLSFLKKVIKRQAALIAKWQHVGFIHGVMNTDNMAISGESIDYGPCAFMDTYDPATVFSSIDRDGSYAYGNQPYIGGWNLSRFAEALLPLLAEDEEEAVKLAEEALSEYPEVFEAEFISGMRLKLGIFNEEKEDKSLISVLLNLMHTHKADFTNTFKALTFNQPDGDELFQVEEFTEWHGKWQKRLRRQDQSKEDSLELMRDNNPAVIPRNHRVEEALQAAVNGDLSVMVKLLEVLANPYEHSTEQAEFCNPAPPSARPYRTFCGT